MALQIKGLRENMLALRGIVSEINGQAQTAIEKGTQLKGHIGDLSTELADHVSDIEFAAGIMGNSAPGSSNGSGAGEKPQKPPVVPPNVMAAVGDRNEPKAAPELPVIRAGDILTIMPDQSVRIEAPLDHLSREFAEGKITAEERAAGEKSLWEAGQAAAATFPGNKL